MNVILRSSYALEPESAFKKSGDATERMTAETDTMS